MRPRWIVFNPAISWIQGDIESATAQGAAASVERHLSGTTTNESWEVYPAPASFPGQDSGYSGGDQALIDLVRTGRKHVVENSKFEGAGYAIAC